MKNKLKSAKSSSKSAAAPQSKTAQTKAGVSPIYDGPTIALFEDVEDGVSKELIDLSKAEYAALKLASRGGKGILMFMSEAALEKAAALAQSKPHGADGAGRGLTIPLQFKNGSVSHVEFDMEQRRRIEAALKRSGMTLETFIHESIRHFLGCSEFALTLSHDKFIEMLSKETRTRTGRSPHLDLEDSIYQAMAFLDLLADRYVKQAEEDDTITGGSRGAGLDRMVQNAIANLHSDYIAVVKEEERLTDRQPAPVATGRAA